MRTSSSTMIGYSIIWFALVLIVAFLAVSCQEKSPSQQPWTDSHISYFYDDRTELCFAIIDPAPNGPEYTHVPCTDLVMERVRRF